MWFGNFLFRSLRLSLIVTLYWLPVLAVVNYAAYNIMRFFQDEPIAMVMIFFLLVMPYFVIQGILAIRGGMTALGVTNGADLNMLGTVTVRVMRFNLPIIMIVTALFGLAATMLAFRLTGSTWLEDVTRAVSFTTNTNLILLLTRIGEFPVIFLGGWIVGLSVAIGLMGVTTAGAAAMAASRPPNHHTIWGLTGEFKNLFFLSLSVMAIPYLLALFALANPWGTIGDLTQLSPVLSYGVAGIFLWSICVISAGIALAYSLTVEVEEEKQEAMMAAIGGATHAAPVDLKSLRQSRMKN